MSRRGLRSACLGRGFSCKPASSMTATSDRPVAAAKAVPAPTEPIKAPPMAGPPVKASVRASSMRALAAGSALGGTRLGTNAGVATLYATVPQAASAPRKASSGHVIRPDSTKHRMARSDAARSPSDQTIRRGRECGRQAGPRGSRRAGKATSAPSATARPPPPGRRAQSPPRWRRRPPAQLCPPIVPRGSTRRAGRMRRAGGPIERSSRVIRRQEAATWPSPGRAAIRFLRATRKARAEDEAWSPHRRSGGGAGSVRFPRAAPSMGLVPSRSLC